MTNPNNEVNVTNTTDDSTNESALLPKQERFVETDLVKQAATGAHPEVELNTPSLPRSNDDVVEELAIQLYNTLADSLVNAASGLKKATSAEQRHEATSKVGKIYGQVLDVLSAFQQL